MTQDSAGSPLRGVRVVDVTQALSGPTLNPRSVDGLVAARRLVPPHVRLSPPRPGEHTDDVLRDAHLEEGALH